MDTYRVQVCLAVLLGCVVLANAQMTQQDKDVNTVLMGRSGGAILFGKSRKKNSNRLWDIWWVDFLLIRGTVHNLNPMGKLVSRHYMYRVSQLKCTKFICP